MLEGRTGIETLKNLTPLDPEKAILISVAAALTVTLMTIFKLPVSSSQAVVGALVGLGCFQHEIHLAGLAKILICWVGTPTGAAVFAILIYRIFGVIYNLLPLNLFQLDLLVRIGLIVAGCYCSFALGANNVANVTAVFVGSEQLDIFDASLIGGCSIALGILTFGRGVMKTVAKNLVALDPFSALVVVTAEALTVQVYALIGVPVSTSQAVVGAVLGIGVLKGIQTIRRSTFASIFIAWFLTPAVGSLLFFILNFFSHLHYVP
jgi:PiT family inorganic phosphate transporter